MSSITMRSRGFTISIPKANALPTELAVEPLTLNCHFMVKNRLLRAIVLQLPTELIISKRSPFALAELVEYWPIIQVFLVSHPVEILRFSKIICSTVTKMISAHQTEVMLTCIMSWCLVLTFSLINASISILDRLALGDCIDEPAEPI